MKKFGIIFVIVVILFTAFYAFTIGILLFKIAIGLMLLCIAFIGGLIGYFVGKKNNCSVAKKAFNAGQVMQGADAASWADYKNQNKL